MFDLNQDAAQTRRFLFFVALGPLVAQLIAQAESKGGSGAEKRKAVVEGVGAGIRTMEQYGYLPVGTLAQLEARDYREVGKLTDATVASYTKSGVFEHEKHDAIAKELERQENETDEAFNARVEAEFQKRQQEETSSAEAAPKVVSRRKGK